MKIEIETSLEALEEILAILENETPSKDYHDELADCMDDAIHQISVQLSEDYRNY